VEMAIKSKEQGTLKELKSQKFYLQFIPFNKIEEILVSANLL
jgi:hypothetical protein